MRLHHKARENETIQWVEAMSLYPYIWKYFKSPVRHSVTHVVVACKYQEVCLCMDGLINCSIGPQQRLYHPVLPSRCNKKLMFCLCKSPQPMENARIPRMRRSRLWQARGYCMRCHWLCKRATRYSKSIRCTNIKSLNSTLTLTRVDYSLFI